MTDDNNKLAKPISFGPKKFGLAAEREKAAKVLASVDPLTVKNRLAIEFDDSGSMQGEPLQNAKLAVRNFTASCDARETSIAVYPMNQEKKELTNDYNLINLYVTSLQASTGGTPLFTKMIELLDAPISRGILFSDGEPTDEWGIRANYYSPDRQLTEGSMSQKEKAITKANEKEIPIDTIFIGWEDSRGFNIMKEIAERTGGIFIHFKDTLSLASNLKYLTPGLRGLLANAEIKEKIQRGEKI